MFTGIIEDKGKVLKIEGTGREKRVTLELPPHLTDVQLGDSINVNGSCLTVSGKRGQTIQVDLSSETLSKTTLSEIKEGREVNLERALRLSDRLGGHLVTGHVDGIGTIIERRKEGDFLILTIQLPKPLSKYVVPKGSVAIDGISLTVNQIERNEIHLSLIPYTLEKTTLIQKKIGDRVNVETDILGKYIEKMVEKREGRSEGVDLSFLKEHGFIKEG